MALLKYFHIVPCTGESSAVSSRDKTSSGLPDPTGCLLLSIVAANKAVAPVCQSSWTEREGPYLKISYEDKAQIGQYASKNSQTSAGRHFCKVQTYILVLVSVFIIIDIREEFASYYST